MVVKTRNALLCAVALTIGTVWVHSEEPGDPRTGRIAIARENPIDETGADALLDAAATVLVSSTEAFWFDLDTFDFDAARSVQAEVIGRLSIERLAEAEGDEAEGDDAGSSGGADEGRDADSAPRVTGIARGERYTIQLAFYRVPHRKSDGATMLPLSEAELSVELDRGGRYQRAETWQPFLDAVASVAEVARPVAVVTIESTRPVTLEGLPPWVEPEVPASPATRFELELRTLRQYDIVATAPGYRPVPCSFYLEYDPFTVDVDPRKYPRHSVGFIPRGVAWPGVEYAWYDAETRWCIYGGVTTFAWGLTPLQQLGSAPKGDERPPRKAKIISSIPLHEIEIGGGRFFRDRDRSGRALVSAAGVLRVTNLDDEWSLEPVSPTALRLGIGWEQELPWRLVLTQRLATDLFWPIRPEFLRNPPWTYRLGPILWQLPIYRLGLRVVL